MAEPRSVWLPAESTSDQWDRRVNAGRWGGEASARAMGGVLHRFAGRRHGHANGTTGGGTGGVSGDGRPAGGSGGRPAAGAPEPAGTPEPAVTREEIRLAIRAVLVHTPQRWPGGLYCSNDRSPYPCRMRHWGEQMLHAAGWDADSIDAMASQADAGLPPWLAGAGDSTPPAQH
jgi:hypothetical protein